MIPLSFFATAGRNLEGLVAAELRELGATDAAETHGGVHFSGDLELAYRVCLWSRLASRVLLVLGRFPSDTPAGLYEAARSIDWSEHLGLGETFAVDARVSHSRITHSQFAALKVKDAVADQFRDRLGRRPSVDPARPSVRINAYLNRDEVTLSLDLSGDSLHRRGYRQAGGAAPLKENLAAAVLLRAGWAEIAREGRALVDPLCGSGTLPIEAAWLAGDVAPGILRTYWGFVGWAGHDEKIWRALMEEAVSRRERGLSRLPDIRGYDHDPEAVRGAWSNVERAGLGGHLHIERRELRDCAPIGASEPGLLVTNPPYGARLGTESDLPLLYRTLGEVLRERFLGWRASVLTGNPELGKRMGLRARRHHSLFNGPIECRLLHFEVTPDWFVSQRQGPRPLAPADQGEGGRMFANRIRKNLRHLSRWLRQEGIDCYRLYDADMPEFALAVDVYEGQERWVSVQEYEAPSSVDPRAARLRLREALGALLDVLAIPEKNLFFKLRRRQRGTAQYEKLDGLGRFHEVGEGGHRFLVNFQDYLDTGLFLDHRPTRALIGMLAGGGRFLNLFGYTGAATVYAAKGGATSTTTVDLSKTYLDWAQRNLELNGIRGAEHELIRADCLQWLDEAAAKCKYDLIFLDPPSFSTSKRMREPLDVQRHHVGLIERAIRLLAPKGILIFSTNLRHFRMDLGALGDLELTDISRATLPKDFERSPRIHQCWRILPRPDPRRAVR